MSQPSGGDPIRIGLVCVHGIGIQAKGATAHDVLHAVELGVSELEGQLELVEPDDAGTPEFPASRALIKIAGAEPFELDIYDAWWDQLVEPPKLRTVLGWLARIVPFVSIAAAAALMDDFTAWRKQTESDDREHDRMPIEFGLPMFASMMLTPLIYAIIPIVALVSLLPRRGASLRRALTAVLGDAWLYKAGKCDAEVLAHIEDVLRCASGNSDVTMLLGHSQGAELARRVAAHTDVGLATCFWVGSGKLPLSLLRTMSQRVVYAPLVIASFISFPVFFYLFVQAVVEMFILMLLQLLYLLSWTIDSTLSDQPNREFTGVTLNDYLPIALHFILSIFGVVTIPMVILLLTRNQNYDGYYTDPDCRVVTIKSPLDPVCFGTVEDREILRYVQPTRPLASHWMGEHTTYFRKPATGRIILEAILGSEAVSNDIFQPKVGRKLKFLSSIAMVAVLAIYLRIGSMELDWIASLRK